MDPARIDVAILCGGKGTRLQSVVPDRPKPLAEVAGTPFLEHLIRWAAGQGFRRFILCAGYMAEQIDVFAKKMARDGLSVECLTEPNPLGTGGALRFAADRMSSDPVLVLNGDSFCDVDLAKFLDFFSAKRCLAALVLAPAPAGEARFGTVEADASGEIRSFQEKAPGPGAGRINAGVYLIGHDPITGMPGAAPFSLEKELFPSLIGNGLFGMRSEGRFIDIGVPEDYRRAQEMFRSA